MTHQELRSVAIRNGLIRWTRSGIFEGVSIRRNVVVATGPVTPLHVISWRVSHDCLEIPRHQLVSVGEMISSRGPIPGVVSEGVEELARVEARFAERMERKRAERVRQEATKLIREIMNR